jgi:putative endonuclease
MWFVYILYSQKDGNLYVGCTQDLNERLERHNSGIVMCTKNRRPLELIYSENFENKTEAFNRERFLKSLWAGRFKKKIKEKYLNGLNLVSKPDRPNI